MSEGRPDSFCEASSERDRRARQAVLPDVKARDADPSSSVTAAHRPPLPRPSISFALFARRPNAASTRDRLLLARRPQLPYDDDEPICLLRPLSPLALWHPTAFLAIAPSF